MPPGTIITFGPNVCGTPAGFELEWLATDGLGGYATGTVAGLRTRRYHGLLVTAEHRLALAALDPVLTLPSGAVVRLAVHEWRSGAISPDGHRHLEYFELSEGVPRWRWRIGEVVLERELAMVRGRAAVGVVHRLVSAPAGTRVRLTLTALCTWRDAHGERDGNGPRPRVEHLADGAVVEDGYRLAGPDWRPDGQWYYGAYAREEAARGLVPVEDLWSAGTFSASLDVGAVLEVSAWAGEPERPPPPAAVVVADSRKRARAVVRAAGAKEDLDRTLALAADAFVVRGPGGVGVVAGYPWLRPQLRDTMTSYEGLFLHTGRAAEGRELLRAHADLGARMREGDGLRDADGPLWFVHALDRHVARTGDTDLAAELLGAAEAVVVSYTKGTRDGVRVDPADGLLAIDADPAGLTWMNARLPGGPVTPRDGKPVELNALWSNALGAVGALREGVGRDASVVLGRRDSVLAHFAKRFRAPEGWLYDVVDARPAAYPKGGGGFHDDPVLRPNQLLAFGLPHAPLGGDERDLAAGVLRAVGAELLTPLGLRTLAPGELGFHGEHRGEPARRDTAYHQGSAWPWLLGPYVDACLAGGRGVDVLLTGVQEHLGEAGLGSVSEVAEGDPPHKPTGAPFSARSVAELIRARALIREHCKLQSTVHGKLARKAAPGGVRGALR